MKSFIFKSTALSLMFIGGIDDISNQTSDAL